MAAGARLFPENTAQLERLEAHRNFSLWHTLQGPVLPAQQWRPGTMSGIDGRRVQEVNHLAVLLGWLETSCCRLNQVLSRQYVSCK